MHPPARGGWGSPKSARVHTCAHACTRTKARVRAHTHTHMCTAQHTNTHAYACIVACACQPAQVTRVRAPRRMFTYTHILTHAHTQAQTHVCTHFHTGMHTHIHRHAHTLQHGSHTSIRRLDAPGLTSPSRIQIPPHAHDRCLGLQCGCALCAAQVTLHAVCCTGHSACCVLHRSLCVLCAAQVTLGGGPDLDGSLHGLRQGAVQATPRKAGQSVTVTSGSGPTVPTGHARGLQTWCASRALACVCMDTDTRVLVGIRVRVWVWETARGKGSKG